MRLRIAWLNRTRFAHNAQQVIAFSANSFVFSNAWAISTAILRVSASVNNQSSPCNELNLDFPWNWKSEISFNIHKQLACSDTIANCLSCNSSTECTSCATSYAINISKTCTIQNNCPPHSLHPSSERIEFLCSISLIFLLFSSIHFSLICYVYPLLLGSLTISFC